MKNAVRTGIFGIIIAVLVVSFYFYLSKRMTSGSEETKAPTQVSTMDEVLEKNFSTQYPGTPRSVIQWYNKIVLLYHDEDTTDQQLVDLCDQAQKLFDDELLKLKPRVNYIASVRSDRESFAAADRKIVSTDVCDSADVSYFTNDRKDYAYVVASYFETEGSGYTRVYQKYCLRKDADNHWKILAFTLCDKEGNITGTTTFPTADTTP